MDFRHDPNDLPGETDWGMLMRGKTMGKRVACQFVPANSVQSAIGPLVDSLELKGADRHALSICITIAPPETLKPGTDLPADLQNVSGTQGNEAQLLLDPADQTVWANPVAILEWGIGGVSARLKCDVSNGLCINITASFVRMKFAVESPTGTPTVSNVVYLLSAFAGPGRPGGWSAQYTKQLGNIADTDSSDLFPVPTFAKRVYVIGNNTDPTILPTTVVQFWKDGQGVEPAGTLFFSGNQPLPGPVPNGAYYYTVNNQSGATIQPMAVFELSA